MRKVILVYCQENQAAADRIVLDISREAEIYRIALSQDKGLEQLVKAAAGNEDVAAILISDNFLKSEACMKDALRVIQDLSAQKRLIPIVTDGVYPKNGSATEFTAVPTSFERVSNVIQYMNFWQDHYLSLRRSKTEPGEDPVFSEKVRSVRSISSEVGEALRFLRSMDYWTFEQLRASRYAPLMKPLGVADLPNIQPAEEKTAYSKIVAVTPTASEKPGTEFSSEPNYSTPPAIHGAGAARLSERPQTAQAVLEPEKKHGFSTTLEEMQEAATLADASEQSEPQKDVRSEHLETTTDYFSGRNKIPEVIENLKNEPAGRFQDGRFSKEAAKDQPNVPAKEPDSSNVFARPLSADSILIHHEAAAGTPPSESGSRQNEEHKPSPNGLESPLPIQVLNSVRQAEEADVEKHPGERVRPLEAPEQSPETEVLKQSLEKNPSNLALRFQYAAQLSQENKFAEASEQLATLLERDKTNVDAYLLLAFIAERNNDFLLSQSLLEKVASLQPDYPGIYYKLATLTKDHFKGQGKKAAQYFREAFARDKGNADAHYQYAIIKLEQSGNYEKAIRHLHKTIQLNPGHPRAHFDLASAYYEQGNKQEAFHHYQRAAAANPAFKSRVNDEIFHYEPPKRSAVPGREKISEVDNGRVVLITGATSGIGRATAEQFARNGFRVILTGRRSEKLKEAKENLETTYKNKVLLLNFDVRSAEEVRQSLGALEEDWRNIEILINNAGLALGFGPIHEGDISDWDTMIDTNVKGLLYMTRAVAPFMVARRKGHIVNICSIAGKEVYPNGNVYAATKHAVDALTKAMRIDLFRYNIRVSQVAPGMVEETEFAKVRFHGDAEKAKIYEDFKPLNSKDVAEIIYFMASRPEHVNIQDVLVTSVQQGSATQVNRSGR